MKRVAFVAVVATTLISGMPNYASAAAWESVPSSWRVQRYQNMLPAHGSAIDGSITTGSIIRASLPLMIEQPRPAGLRFRVKLNREAQSATRGGR